MLAPFVHRDLKRQVMTSVAHLAPSLFDNVDDLVLFMLFLKICELIVKKN